jgi:hypothetical protein
MVRLHRELEEAQIIIEVQTGTSGRRAESAELGFQPTCASVGKQLGCAQVAPLVRGAGASNRAGDALF